MNVTLSLNPSSLTAFKEMEQPEKDKFWQLWNLHRDFLLRQCLKWLKGDYFSAEDILDIVLFKFASYFSTKREQMNNIKAWLTKITYNTCIDLYRKKRKEVNYGENIELFNSIYSSYLTSSVSPDSLLLNQELWLVLSQSIQSLPSALRTPFMLRFWHNFSSQKIAKQLGISLETVYKRIQKAKQILQKYLKPYLAGISSLKFSVSSSLSHTFSINFPPSSNQSNSVISYASLESLHQDLLISDLQKGFPSVHNLITLLGW